MSSNNIDLSGIKRFRQSIKKIQTNTQPTEKNQNLIKFGGFAYKILSEAYTGTKFQVGLPQYYAGGFNIHAKGEGIAFDEFGTGIYADGTYKGKLPTETLSFESAGYPQTTKGWEYYYDWQGPDYLNPKDMLNGRLGWFTAKGYAIFSEGHPASNRFYDACQKIKEQIKEDNK